MVDGGTRNPFKRRTISVKIVYTSMICTATMRGLIASLNLHGVITGLISIPSNLSLASTFFNDGNERVRDRQTDG